MRGWSASMRGESVAASWLAIVRPAALNGGVGESARQSRRSQRTSARHERRVAQHPWFCWRQHVGMADPMGERDALSWCIATSWVLSWVGTTTKTFVVISDLCSVGSPPCMSRCRNLMLVQGMF